MRTRRRGRSNDEGMTTTTTTINSSSGSSLQNDNEMESNIVAILNQLAFQQRKATNIHHQPFHESSLDITPILRSRRYCRSIFLGTVVVVILVQFCAFVAIQQYWKPTTIRRNTRSLRRETQSLLQPRFQEHPRGIIRPYQLWTSENIYERLHEWTQEYPRLVELTSAQEEYNLPGAGEDSDCQIGRAHV